MQTLNNLRDINSHKILSAEKTTLKISIKQAISGYLRNLTTASQQLIGMILKDDYIDSLLHQFLLKWTLKTVFTRHWPS